MPGADTRTGTDLHAQYVEKQGQVRQRQRTHLSRCLVNKLTQSPNPQPRSQRLPTPYTWYGEKPQHRHTHTTQGVVLWWAQEILPPPQRRYHRQRYVVAYVVFTTATPTIAHTPIQPLSHRTKRE